MYIIDREFLNVTTPSCHAGTICFYKNKPIYAFFGGSREGAVDVAIYIQCGKKTHIIGDKEQVPYWNPILFLYENQLYLFVKIGVFCDRWQSLIFNISDILDKDFDIKKAPYQILPAGLNGPVKTKPIVDNGTIYCGSSVETIIDWSSYVESYEIKNGIFEFVNRSKPLTVPRRIYEDPYYGKRQTMGIIQPSLWEDGEVFNAFFRSSRGLGKIYHSYSDGVRWSNPVETKFLNPNSGIDTVFYNDRLFLVHNPSDTTRSPLVLSELDRDFNVISEIILQEKVEGRANSPELSYPYLIENDGQLHCVYTYGRSKIEAITIGI